MVCEQQIKVNEELTEKKIDISSEKSEQPITLRGESIKVTESKDYERLYNKPRINGVELIGDKTSKDLKIIGDKNYVHNQTESSDTWVIEHNLDKLPSVNVIDSADEEVVGEITYDNLNQVTIKFKAAFKGKATLN